MLARGGGPLWRAKRWVLQVRSAPHQESLSGVALLLFITWTYCNLVRIVGAYSHRHAKTSRAELLHPTYDSYMSPVFSNCYRLCYFRLPKNVPDKN